MAGGLDTRVTDAWMPQLPQHWSIERLQWRSWIRARLGWKGLTADEYVSDGVPLLSTPDIKMRTINYAGANRVTQERYDESPEIRLRNGDVLLTKDGATIGIVNVVRELPEPATVNGSIAVITTKPGLLPQYLMYALASHYGQQVMLQLQGGMGVPHLFQADIKRIRIPVPPRPEQQVLADFLDRETTKIDALIEKQTALVERLRERRRQNREALVLGRNTASRTDTSYWFGSIPSHWTTPRLSHRSSVVLGRMINAGSLQGHEVELPYLAAGSIQPDELILDDSKSLSIPVGEVGKYTLRRGDIVVVEGGAGYGRSHLLREDLPGWAFQNHVARVRLRGDCFDPRYLREAIEVCRLSGFFEANNRTATLPSLSRDVLGGLRMPCPPPSEQRAIADRLDRETARIDALIAKAERFVELARERRSALITAAVTGQLDVLDTPERQAS